MRRATRVACVSQFTLNDARRILKEDRNLCLVLNGLNYPYQLLPSDEVDRRLAGVPGIQAPFILHVGSHQPRKNCEGLLRIFARVAERTDLQLVLRRRRVESGTHRACKQVASERPNGSGDQARCGDVIEALYNRAVALLFPSRYEGFGWPTIEAQACGCPVVATDIPPLVEALGQSAALKPVDDEDGMAESIRRLATDPEYREQMRQSGFQNVRSRFQTSRMIGDYVSLYRELVCQS